MPLENVDLGHPIYTGGLHPTVIPPSAGATRSLGGSKPQAITPTKHPAGELPHSTSCWFWSKVDARQCLWPHVYAPTRSWPHAQSIHAWCFGRHPKNMAPPTARAEFRRNSLLGGAGHRVGSAVPFLPRASMRSPTGALVRRCSKAKSSSVCKHDGSSRSNHSTQLHRAPSCLTMWSSISILLYHVPSSRDGLWRLCYATQSPHKCCLPSLAIACRYLPRQLALDVRVAL